MNKGLLLTAIILLIFVVFVMPDRANETSLSEQASNPDLLQADFDYFISDMELERFFSDGTHNYSLTAERVTHYPDGDYSILQEPDLLWKQQGKPDWSLNAKQGLMQKDSASGLDTLYLEENVLVVRAGKAEQALTIATEKLQVQPDARELHSQELVTIYREGMFLQGKGLNALLHNNYIELLSDVRGQYD